MQATIFGKVNTTLHGKVVPLVTDIAILFYTTVEHYCNVKKATEKLIAKQDHGRKRGRF